MLVRHCAQETDLLAVAATPLAHQQMEPQSQARAERGWAFQRVGLRPHRLTAVRQQRMGGGSDVFPEIHSGLEVGRDGRGNITAFLKNLAVLGKPVFFETCTQL